jgi:predicted small lipoprotein YifL
MSFKMPKPFYQIVLGALLFSFTLTACGNKGGKDKAVKKDTAAVEKPVDENNKPVPPPQ